jgi:hypothetical protein
MSAVVELVVALVGSALDALNALTADRHRRGIRRARHPEPPAETPSPPDRSAQ